ncbi:MAG TPA: DUF805 domain-containing protein [Bradyrhizobium sp.]|uniref:DUF805 domain-containing protein n=1 Tax=Bradyrhizobium sp. TaxID=376 RepID=UPI002BBA52BA|nr:DUF805 domain-containing protein [Bradyrhizobium sp.]HLZ04429.1 DUF805 domain-containing protein [Bradyrhizobium sp.]
MDWAWFLFGFRGRINRAKYWLSGLVLVGWMIFVIWMIYLCLQLMANGYLPIPRKIHFGTNAIFALFDPASFHALSRADVIPILINVVGMPVFLWIYLATSIKRLHDRDRSGWWMIPFFAVPGLYQQFEARLPDSYFLLPVALAVFALMIWGFIELYCLKGSASINQFGSNPLGKQQMRRRSTQTRLRATTAWDQTSEIELTPHRASPPPSMHVKREA